jgi:hypothetical protein
MSGGVGSVGAVVIGRNEGERLKRCLTSLSCVTALVIVVTPNMAA